MKSDQVWISDIKSAVCIGKQLNPIYFLHKEIFPFLERCYLFLEWCDNFFHCWSRSLHTRRIISEVIPCHDLSHRLIRSSSGQLLLFLGWCDDLLQYRAIFSRRVEKLWGINLNWIITGSIYPLMWTRYVGITHNATKHLQLCQNKHFNLESGISSQERSASSEEITAAKPSHRTYQTVLVPRNPTREFAYFVVKIGETIKEDAFGIDGFEM